MSKTFTARAEFSTRFGDSQTLRYQHRIVWNEDGKKWDCIKCHRSSGYTHQYEALIGLAEHDCTPSGAAQEN